ncbi:MAG: TonB-dependent receptor [Chitinophagaceae bacterium]|nr:MAG: TonB-dependent receptor [Chitinophagaceae bacterium]
MNKIHAFLLAAFSFLLTEGFSQATVITGIVKDVAGPVAGASITEKGQPANGVMANELGQFSLTLKGNAQVLIISAANHQNTEIDLRNFNTNDVINVNMQLANASMDEVVIVGFGKKKRITNTGSVSSVTGAEIRTVPTSSVQNALQGKVPGFFAQQRSGQPGRDASDYYIRGVSSLNAEGNRPLIVVDDIEYTYEQLAQINVNEIESISILKDASTTAVYGIKGANGVLVVTTRRGISGRPKFNLRGEVGLQAPVRTPKFLNAYHTALLVNEAYRNDGLQPQFSQQDLDLFKSGADPYGHPDVNWYESIMKPYSLQANTNLDISGGSQAVKYFISAGAFTQDGSVRNFSTNTDGVNSNYFYKRYNVRSNLDIQATRNLSLRLDMTSRFGDVNEPHSNNVISNIYDFSMIRPYSAPFLNPNGSYAYAHDTRSQMPTINAMLQSNGYRRQRRTDFNVLFGFTQKLDDLTPGLSLLGRIAYAGVEQNTLTLFRFGFPPSYKYDPLTDTYSLNTGVSSGGYTLTEYYSTGNTDTRDQRLNMQFYLNYDRTFGPHHFSSLLLWNQQGYRVDKSIFTQGEVPQKSKGYSLKLGYDFEQKYLIDFNAAYNGSDRFQSSKRYGFFPAVGIGWNMAQEAFFIDNVPFLKLAKLRASYGLVGSDVARGNQYLYNQVYLQGWGYSFGQNHQFVPSISEGPLGNDNVTWEKAKKYNVGLDLNSANDKFALTVDYFHEERYDQLVERQDIPAMLGIGISPTNVAIVVNRGWDGQFTYRDKIGQLQYSLGLVLSYAKNKVIYQAEAQPRFPWLARTGQSINQPFGYTYTGFYTEADLSDPKVAKPVSAIALQAGDLRYKDMNGDGVIDQSDMTAIGRPNLPNTNLGLPIRLNYKNLDLNILFQGAFGYSLGLVGNAIEPFKSQFQPLHQLRWTPETAATAQFPRLTSNPTTVNSPLSYMSDFWLVDAHYMRLKTVDIGYQVPNKFLPFKINNGRLYLSAYNLLTWSNLSKKYQQDPEVASNSAGDAYLNQRVVNLGLQILWSMEAQRKKASAKRWCKRSAR